MPAVQARAALLLASHLEAFGRPLLALGAGPSQLAAAGDARHQAQELFAAPLVVLAHDDGLAGGTPAGADPRLIYANATALRLWRRPWAAMVGLPSQLTAEPAERQGREQMLALARRRQAISGYRGVRIDSCGRRFVIDGARLWTLRDSNGRDQGQAAAFSHWWWL
ncbi:MEKHLA domain-containing protein [Synechococcus sp. ATX 2A4]|nr:MEKHLA domain-containing protein [Synechococcus sp. ATX 2A4]